MADFKVAGSVHKATVDGFKRMLVEANRVAQDGYELLAVVPLADNRFGCVFRRGSMLDKATAAEVALDSFFE